MCTTSFLAEISQYITIGDLTGLGNTVPQSDIEAIHPLETHLTLPSLSFDDIDGFVDLAPKLTSEEEDALLKVKLPSNIWSMSLWILRHQDSTGDFPDWVANFIRRVIQLLENLPEEGPNQSSGGTTEGTQK